MDRIAVIGAGAWGTALATVARRAGREVVLWALEPEVAAAVNARHENELFLPGIPLDPGIRATTQVEDACNATDLVLLVPPAQHLRAVTRALLPVLPASTGVVICSKGIEQGSCALMAEVFAEEAPTVGCATLSGPTLAHEVARGLPTAVTLASRRPDLAQAAARALSSRSFKVYVSDDVSGAELGGAIKNVLAIACGIALGLGLGENARAAIMTRGLAEMVRLAAAKGARPETLMGLSGLGDLALTCGSTSSRNTSLGIALGEGHALSAVLSGRRAVTEGVASSLSVTDLARRLNVEMPICSAVRGILYDGRSPRAAIDTLLARPLRPEVDGG